MKPHAIALLACLALPLAACEPSDDPFAGVDKKQVLPAIPQDLRQCFKGVAEIPDRDLTVEEVERLWKQDRIRSVAKTRCGLRLITWYDALRKRWR